MFGGVILEKLPTDQREKLIAAIEREAQAMLYRDGTWVMDYRRLRVMSKRVKTGGNSGR